MLASIVKIADCLADEIGKECCYTLEQITNAAIAVSPIDEVIFVGFAVPVTNPIWGQFWKYGRTPTPYAGFKTTAEIRYAEHLSIAWRRFVVCKELCHALDSDEGSHSVTDRSVTRILDSFALMSANKELEGITRAFNAEMLAEVGALELMCPIKTREQIIARGNLDIAALCQKYEIPDEFGPFAFSAEMTAFLRSFKA